MTDRFDENTLSPAKKALMEQIRAQKAQMDPSVLEKVRSAVEIKEGRAEPYDKKNASLAIRLFLENHRDSGGFEERLLKLMDQSPA